MAFEISLSEMRDIAARIEEEVVSKQQIENLTIQANDEQLAKLKLQGDHYLIDKKDYIALMINTLEPAYLKKIRGWIRNRRYRAKPIQNSGDKISTINISKKNVWALEQLKQQFDSNHPGADIKQDEILERALSLLAKNYANKVY